jgi:hypothetical protein
MRQSGASRKSNAKVRRQIVRFIQICLVLVGHFSVEKADEKRLRWQLQDDPVRRSNQSAKDEGEILPAS